MEEGYASPLIGHPSGASLPLAPQRVDRRWRRTLAPSPTMARMRIGRAIGDATVTID
jgi:hypothetical protein